jgi:CRISPR/Cas system-associated endonuclease Cas3-HD
VGNKKILSYYERRDSDTVSEYLIDHIVTCLEFLGELKSSKIGRFCTSLHEDFCEAVRLSVSFHDIGKVFYQYEKDKRYISFIGHEILSFFLFKEFVKKLKENPEIDVKYLSKTTDTALFSVFFHHHAMGINRRINNIKNLDPLQKINYNVFQDLLSDLSLLVGRYISLDEFDILSSVINEVSEKIFNGNIDINYIIRDSKYTLGDQLWKKVIGSDEESIRFKKLAYSVLSILVCVDNLSAQKLRKNTTTGFTKILEGFYSDYLKTWDVSLPTSLLT